MDELFIKARNVKEISEKGIIKGYNDLKKFIEDNRDECEHMAIEEYSEEDSKKVIFTMEINAKLDFLSTAVMFKKITDGEMEFIGKELIELGKEIVGE